MAVAHAVTPFVTIYSISGSTFTKLTNPSTLPTGTGNGVSFSPDGAFMAVAHDITTFVTIYSVFIGNLTKWSKIRFIVDNIKRLGIAMTAGAKGATITIKKMLGV
jgi:hypothetical protein